MNEQNIMENNEVLEVADDMARSNSGLGWKIIGGALIAAGAIYGGLKLRRKIKAKKEEDKKVVDVADNEQPIVVTECVEVEENEKKNKKKN